MTGRLSPGRTHRSSKPATFGYYLIRQPIRYRGGEAPGWLEPDEGAPAPVSAQSVLSEDAESALQSVVRLPC
jgi:hypothetical protein